AAAPLAGAAPPGGDARRLRPRQGEAMISVPFAFAAPSAVTSAGGRDEVLLTADARRPVRFRARMERHSLSLRLALPALGSVLWSGDPWRGGGDREPGPVACVDRDRLSFEVFGGGTYALVAIDRDYFEPEGEVVCGATRVEFGSWLWNALGGLRS